MFNYLMEFFSFQVGYKAGYTLGDKILNGFKGFCYGLGICFSAVLWITLMGGDNTVMDFRAGTGLKVLNTFYIILLIALIVLSGLGIVKKGMRPARLFFWVDFVITVAVCFINYNTGTESTAVTWLILFLALIYGLFLTLFPHLIVKAMEKAIPAYLEKSNAK